MNEYALRKTHGIKFNWLSVNEETIAKFEKVKPKSGKGDKKIL